MLVFYSGWGYWEYDCIAPFDGKDEREIIDKSPLVEVKCLFKLPKKEEKEFKNQNETTVSYLLEYKSLDDDGLEFNDFRFEPISDPRFILCHEMEGERKFSIDDRPIIEKTVVFTKVFEESHVNNDAQINETEAELNIILMQSAYLDPKHPMFSKELEIAIQAWNDVLKCTPEKPKSGSRKKMIESWLEIHHKTLSQEAKKRITILLNPDKNGGAPSTD